MFVCVRVASKEKNESFSATLKLVMIHTNYLSRIVSLVLGGQSCDVFCGQEVLTFLGTHVKRKTNPSEER